MTGAELAAIRKAAGLSQSDLARRAGIGRHAVSYWETKPEVDRRAWAVCRMAEVMDLPRLHGDIRARALRAERLYTEAQASRAAIDAHFAKLRPSGPPAVTVHRVMGRIPCGAKTRKGTPCQMRSVPGKRRCKFHGGMSTGAKTPEGRERIAEAQRQRWARWRAEHNGPDGE